MSDFILKGIAVFAITIFLYGCKNQQDVAPQQETPIQQTASFQPGNAWNEYWYSGQAELSSYDLDQARYGEMREGEAVLMFVTENFDAHTHTKANQNSKTTTPTLKVNFDKKFLTGVYPYSMLMTAVSPVDIARYPHAITVSGSVQEWCGHTFTQFNQVGKTYKMTEHSYFPGEGDQTGEFNITWLEDEIWTRIRIAPDELPTGTINMMPGIFSLRFRHAKIVPISVSASFSEGIESSRVYNLNYDDGRFLKIEFEKDFPHRILGWEESGTSGLITSAKLKSSIKLDYWNKNGNDDLKFREDLKLLDTGL